ncbi:hypothetical protein COPG_00008 [Colwellia phage 9A]|uniref:Uncharacterized protein n=1 Tax=Colwellia phage 9A TaxID=765765 RepID=I3UM89_9CAUD|nr:hypothetical protein COPG_00008 [Colwellia phage 9A]AFK66604.1 hypothetical protein COPG_00008 [Colwellia phage 9A]
MNNNNFGSFALPTGFDWEVKTFARQVTTRVWCGKFKKHLSKYAEKLTTANSDPRQIIGGMLQAAYGANIGAQVENLLTDEKIAKIKKNILFVIY